MQELFEFDKTYCDNPCLGLMGVDEAGRGAFAGPVLAACVWLKPAFFEKTPFTQLEKVRIQDSKLLKLAERELLYTHFLNWRSVGWLDFKLGLGSVKEIESHNILGATRLAMARALDSLADEMPEALRIKHGISMPLWDRLETRKSPRILVDGLPLRPFPYVHEPVVKGDRQSLAIGIASIIVKVERDRLMNTLSEVYSGYGLESHKGYGTLAHRKAIKTKGPLPIHRSLYLRKVI